MTSSSQQPIIPPAMVPGLINDGDDATESDRELVGASDADADAARSGADVDLEGAERDSDGVPVGRADLEADKRS
jgi:hypothetical protein